MGKLVFVVAKSGAGKSTSLRKLNPDETVIVNSDQKPLPFKKSEGLYSEEKGNYLRTSNIEETLAKLKDVSKNQKHVKSFVIDTWSRIMTDFIMSKQFRRSQGFEKWGEFNGKMYDLLNLINDKVREDLVVYLFCHPETVYDEAGFPQEQIAVQGQQLKKFAPESFSSVVLYGEIIHAPGMPNEHVFRTINSGSDTCKSPIGMFEKDDKPLESIPNDLSIVQAAIDDYF